MSTFMIRTVVFATDFSDLSRRAGRVAADLARSFGSRLHVIHVDPPVTEPALASRMAGAVAELGGGVQAAAVTVAGLPARAICAYARRVRADLVVVGTHGRTGLSRAVLGSVAEAVVRHAPCPVMTVPAASEVADAAEPAPAAERCVACAAISSDLICEPCRAIIRDGTHADRLGLGDSIDFSRQRGAVAPGVGR